MRGGIGLQRSKVLGEKMEAAERRLSRQTWRSVMIGAAIGAALYLAAFVIATRR